MMLEDFSRDFVHRRADSQHLGNDVLAVALIVQHADDSAYLAFDGTQPVTIIAVVLFYECGHNPGYILLFGKEWARDTVLRCPPTESDQIAPAWGSCRPLGCGHPFPDRTGGLALIM